MFKAIIKADQSNMQFEWKGDFGHLPDIRLS